MKLLDDMDGQMWTLLQRNLSGVTEDEDPTAYLDGTVPELIARLAGARERCRTRLGRLTTEDLVQAISYFGRYEVTTLELLKTHALHLAGHRFQVRYVRGTYSRAHGTRKADFDPW